MSAIQASTGLITGLPIEDTVDQLIAIAGRRRDLVSNRNLDLESERAAFNQVSSLLLGIRFSATQLSRSSLYSATTATSSNDQIVSANAIPGETATPGTYSITPLQLASASSFASNSIATGDALPSSGTLSFGFGGQVDESISLAELNDGAGFDAGSIRIADRSGSSAVIDLRTAQTVEDVIREINSSTEIEVTAGVDGDQLSLTDTSGGTGSLRVTEVGIGTTAASLGLDGIDAATSYVTGTDIYDLYDGTKLRTLNDGLGIRFRDEVDDIEITLADESTLSIDLSETTTVGEVVSSINTAAGSRLTAEIEAGNSLKLTDNTSGSGQFAVANVGNGTAADDLGLTGTASGSTITGNRLIGGLSDTLTRTLNGGQGLGTLGQITLTDRNATSDTVDLSSAETLRDIISIINSASTSITASVNDTRDGIELSDTSGGSGNLIVASADANNSAEALGIVVNSTVDSIDGGSLTRQTVGENTLLSSLNGGRGVSIGDIRLTNSDGTSVSVSLDTTGSEAETVGDVIDAINAVAPSIEARINDTGDGIVLEDKANGSGTLTVAEVGNGTTAADLQLLGASSETNGSNEQIIDGRQRIDVDLSTLSSGTDSILLSSLRGGAGITLGVFRITDAAGVETNVNLNESGNEAFTVTDVIDKINAAATSSGASITAAVNGAGTGITITDSSGGTGTLTVADLGSGTSAAELGISGEGRTSGTDQLLNGDSIFSNSDSDDSGLSQLAALINEKGLGFSAQTIFDGTGQRLVLTADELGGGNQLRVSSQASGFALNELSRGADALAQLGGVTGVVAASSNNIFSNIVPGVRFTANEVSSSPVTINVVSDTNTVVDAANDFVASYNSLRSTIDSLADFDSESLTTGILFGRSEIVRIDSDLGRLISGRIVGAGPVTSLESIGISLNSDGELELDESKFRDAYESSPNDIEQFFTTESTGVVDRLTTSIDQLAGGESSLLASRSDALTRNIDANNERIEFMNGQLERQRERMLLDFYRLEETIARVQNNLSSVESISAIPPLSFANRSN